MLSLDEAGFVARFNGSPIKRIGRARMVHNACVAAGNSGLSELRPLLEKLARQDASALVREHAAWAVDRLGVV